MEKPPLMPLWLLFLSFPHRGPVRICGSPAQLASALRCMQPDVSSGCNTEVSPRGWAVESPAVIVRCVCWTEELIKHFGNSEPEWAIMWASHGEAENVVSQFLPPALTTFPRLYTVSYFPPLLLCNVCLWMWGAWLGLAELRAEERIVV